MRALGGCLAFIFCLGFAVFGVAGLINGVVEQSSANDTYQVLFLSEGAQCNGKQVAFDVSDGSVLSCGLPGVHPPSAPADFPGFTKAQDKAVTELASNLGGDGDELTAADRARIQHEVDRYAATVPDSRRPHYDEKLPLGPLWGARLALTGGVCIVAAVVLYVLIRRGARR